MNASGSQAEAFPTLPGLGNHCLNQSSIELGEPQYLQVLASTSAGEGVGSDALQRNRPAISNASERTGGSSGGHHGQDLLPLVKRNAAPRAPRKVSLLQVLAHFH